jgi:hypothetical protein
MNDSASKSAALATPTPASSVRKPYQRPGLKEFGKLHLRTQGSGGNGQDGAGTMTMQSDRRAKENIVRIGDHPAGVGLYLFDYKPEFRDAWGHGRQMGVMADEVERVMPRAVSVQPDGYKVVDYAMLGISRTRH